MDPQLHHSQIAMLGSCGKVMEITMILDLRSCKAHCLHSYQNFFFFFLTYTINYMNNAMITTFYTTFVITRHMASYKW